MSSDYDGGYAGAFLYTFESEGSKTFTVEASKAGKKKSVQVTAKYEIGAPTLNIDQTDQMVTNKKFELSGKATDDNYSVTVNINGQSAYMNYNGTFSESFTLNEGENKFNVVATNENGKQTTKSVTITYSVGAPTLTLNQNDQSVTSKFFTLTGKATDDNYSVTVTINGQSAYMNYNGTFSESFTLNEGENKFTVVATNENGKQTTKSITVTLEVGSPIISFINCPETTTQKSISIIGTVGGERNGVYLFVNDKQWSVSSNGKFEQNVSLRNGVNTFDFRAVNSYGKETIVTKIITYSPSNTNDEQ
ncbi:MAG: hypothetical protein M0R40_07950 [Firmicutes bacterium]|nr:hypothetical protein [Bacillota bacterium]